MVNASWNSNCSLAKHILNVFLALWSAILICSQWGSCPFFKLSIFQSFFLILSLWFDWSYSVLIQSKLLSIGYLKSLQGSFEGKKVIYYSMNTTNMETSITSETISQQTVCGEMEVPNKDWKFPEIAKKVPHTCNKDKKLINGGITEIEQTQNDWIKLGRFILIWLNHRKWLVQSTPQRREWWERGEETSQDPKGATGGQQVWWGHKSDKTWKFRPSTDVLHEMWTFQKSTELLNPKIAMFHIINKILQKEWSWLCIQASTVLAIHEATEVYLMWLHEYTNFCTIHTKCVMILQKDVQLACGIWGETSG